MWRWLHWWFRRPKSDAIVDEKDVLVTLTAIKFLVDNHLIDLAFPDEYSIWIKDKRFTVGYHPSKLAIQKVLAFLFRNDDVQWLAKQTQLVDEWIDGQNPK